MSAGKKRVSFGFSKLLKKPKVILPALKPAETINFIKCVENNSVQVFDEVIEDEEEELVIPMRLSSRSSDLKPKATDSSNNPVLDSKKPESLDELAAKELVAEANRLQTEEEEASTIVVPLVSNLPSGEKESTLEDYKSIPIEKYGLAMLRGMGWKPGIGIAYILQTGKIPHLGGLTVRITLRQLNHQTPHKSHGAVLCQMITVIRQISKDPPTKLPKLVITKKFSNTKLPPRILTEGGLQDTPAVIIQKGPSHFVPVPLVQTSPGVFVLGTSLADTVNISMNPGVSTSDSTSNGETKTLFDFTDSGITDLKSWREISDTVRDVGMSKASFVVQKTQKFQRAVFFTMLNPQPNGAGFAGVSTSTPFNLQKFQNILIHARAQGSVTDYKIVLRHKGLNQEPHPTYEQTFNVPLNEFTTISLPLSNFDPYYRGRKLNSSEAEPLDTSQISSFGFQVYGGVYHPKKQSGISAFEVDWVKAK